MSSPRAKPPRAESTKARPAQALRRVRVGLGARSYDIVLGFGTLSALGAALRARLPQCRSAMLVAPPPVARHYGARAAGSLRAAGLRVRRIAAPDGERSKNLASARRLYEEMLNAEAQRGTAVVALGGGVVGDLAGFVAATLLRGLPLVQVPTTLLAMADASVGGKTGVNLPLAKNKAGGKNLVGAFHQPCLVWMDAATLQTLPPRQLRAGWAEVVKHAAICDAALFARLERNAERLLAGDPQTLLPVLARNCRIKASVVAKDEREAGPRALLNFGHTLGHAVEALSGYRVLHGEAVAMGMVHAAALSESLGLCPSGARARLAELLERFGLPTQLPAHPRAHYLRAIASDKKRSGAQIRCVVLREIGRAELLPLRPAQFYPARPARRGATPRRSATAQRGGAARRG